MTSVARTLDVTARQAQGRLAGQALQIEGRREPRTAATGCSVDVISDPATFVHLEAEWNDAVERAGLTHPFLRHEWVRTWWDAFAPPGARLHVLVVRAEGRITAIAPFMRDTSLMYGVPARRIRFLQNDQTPRADIIIAARPEESYRAVWRALRTDRDRWDVLQLSQVERASDTRRAFCELAYCFRLVTCWLVV